MAARLEEDQQLTFLAAGLALVATVFLAAGFLALVAVEDLALVALAAVCRAAKVEERSVRLLGGANDTISDETVHSPS